MTPVVLMVMQAATTVPPTNFDLRDLPSATRCGSGQDGEIVVCGNLENRRQRLQTLPDDRYVEPPPKAETKLFGSVTGSAVVESKSLPGGATSDRIMVRIEVPF